MNYTKASEAPNGTDVPLVVKLPVAIAVAARARIAAGDLTAAKVLVNLDRVCYAIRYPLLVDLTATATDANLTVNGLQLVDYAGGSIVSPANVGPDFGVPAEGLWLWLTILIHGGRGVTLKNQSGTGTAGERFLIPIPSAPGTDGDYVGAGSKHVTCKLYYSLTMSRWLVSNIMEYS